MGENIHSKYLVKFYTLLLELDLPKDDALRFSKCIISLGCDMSSFYNSPIEKVYGDLSSALSGNTSALYRYGLPLDYESIRNRAIERGLAPADSTTLTKKQKIIATYGLIRDNSKEIEGSFSKYTGTSLEDMVSWNNIIEAFDMTLENLESDIVTPNPSSTGSMVENLSKVSED